MVKFKKILSKILFSSFMTFCFCTNVFASTNSDLDAFSADLVSAFGDVTGSTMSGMKDIIPYALTIFGAFLLIVYVKKYFRKASD